MLIACTLIVMLIVAYFYLQEGLFTAATMFVNVFLAGLLTFNFWEPLATSLGSLFQGTFMKGYEDILVLVGLFCTFLLVLRAVTNKLSDEIIEFPGKAQQVGGAAFGLLTGYLLSGFLVCALQTLPWGWHFLDFEPRSKDESPLRRLLPPDRVWLALMSRGSTAALGRSENPEQGFDPAGTFESNYLRFRRTR